MATHSNVHGLTRTPRPIPQAALAIAVLSTALWAVHPIAPASAEEVSTPVPSILMVSEPLAEHQFLTAGGRLVLDADFDGRQDVLLPGGFQPPGAQFCRSFIDAGGVRQRECVGEVPPTTHLLFGFSPSGGMLFPPVPRGEPSIFPIASPFVAGDAVDLHAVLATNFVLGNHVLVWRAGASGPLPAPGWPQFGGVGGGIIADLRPGGPFEYIYDANGSVFALPRAAPTADWFEPITPENFDLEAIAAVADLDGSGSPELVLTGTESGGEDDFAAVVVLNATGQEVARWREAQPWSDLSYTDAAAVGDVNRDGQVDIVVPFDEYTETADDFFDTGGLRVLRLRDGALQQVASRSFPRDTTISEGPIIADVDPSLPGAEILVVTSGDEEHVRILRGDTLADVGASPITSPASISSPLLVGDLDGDPSHDQEVLFASLEGLMALHHTGESYTVVNGTVVDIPDISVDATNNAYKLRRVTGAGEAVAVYFERLQLVDGEGFTTGDVYIFPGNANLPAEGQGASEEFDRRLAAGEIVPVQQLTGTYRGWSISVPRGGGNPSLTIVLRGEADTGVANDGYRVTQRLDGTSQTLAALVTPPDGAAQQPEGAGAGGFLQGGGATGPRPVGAPLLADVNGDNQLDLVHVTQTTRCEEVRVEFPSGAVETRQVCRPVNGRVIVASLNLPYRPQDLQWPMFRHDLGRTNAHRPPVGRPLNAPPHLQPIFERGMVAGDRLTFTVRAVDLPQEQLQPARQLTFTARQESGASLAVLGATVADHGNNSATFAWATTPTQAGDYPLVFTVTDGTLSDSERVVVHVHQGPFIRGDANGDGGIDVSDAVTIFLRLFANPNHPIVLEAMDVNDDGLRDLSDGIYLLNAIFLGGPRPPPPYPTPGTDPTP